MAPRLSSHLLSRFGVLEDVGRLVYCFKYCAPTAEKFGMLARGELFFASADELNDGSECRPRYVLKGSAELWNRLADMILLDACCFSSTVPGLHSSGARELAGPLGRALQARAGVRDLDFDALTSLIYEALPPLLAGIELGIAPAAFMRLVDRACRLTRQHLNEPMYMASLSKNPRDPTMWGHYGNAERGFCVVLHAPEQRLRIHSPIHVFPGCRQSSESGIQVFGIYSSAEVELRPILYRSAPLRFNAFHRLIPHFLYSEEEHHYDVPLLLPGEAPARTEDRLGLVKATTWKYEQEVRAIMPSEGELAPEARCVRYDWSHAAGLIFGPKMPQSDRARAVVCCHLQQEAKHGNELRSGPFVFLEARQRVDSFQMALVPVGVLDGIYSPPTLPLRPLSQCDAATVAEVEDVLAKMQAASQSTQHVR